MNAKKEVREPGPESWGLETGPGGALLLGNVPLVQLAATYGTPLHVVHEDRLAATASDFCAAFSEAYPGVISVHYAFKCNPVPGVVEIIRRQGMKAEVMSRFELALALCLGFSPEEIIVNGPFKPDALLEDCLSTGVRFIIADSIDELRRIDRIAGAGRSASVLLRINPDFVPRGMNSGTATGSRSGSAFGLDLKGGEVNRALRLLKELPSIDFKGFHFHIGSGIRYPEAYYKGLLRLKPAVEQARELGYVLPVIDIGGGFGTPLSREMNTAEMLWYQATRRLPDFRPDPSGLPFKDFAAAVLRGIRAIFPDGDLPELIIEPGRSIASSNQLLLLNVHAVKSWPGLSRRIITDGGIGTVSMPVYYEFHQVFLCDDVHRPVYDRATINGPGCFAADVVYYNRPMPKVKPGEILAVMDSGAYFTSWESNFGFPRPAIVAVKDGICRLLRSRERFEEMMVRDVFNRSCLPEPV